MIIIAEVIKENSDEFEISVVEVDAPFVITKVKDKLYIYKGGNCILTKALSLEIFEDNDEFHQKSVDLNNIFFQFQLK